MQVGTRESTPFTAGEVAEATGIPPREILARCREGSIEHQAAADGTVLVPGRELDRILGDGVDRPSNDGRQRAAGST